MARLFTPSESKYYLMALDAGTGSIPVVKEATALGCAIAAGVGAGIFSSMAETGERLVRWERTHTPDPEKHELYQDSRDKWQAVYQDQLGLVDHGLTTSLWKAPGL